MRRLLATAVALGIALVACGGSGPFPDGSFAVRANSELAPGPERLLIGVIGPEGERLGDPDTAVTIRLAPLDDPGRDVVVNADFMWIVESAVGLYRADVVFNEPGEWQATVSPAGGEPLEPVVFSVLADGFAPRIGEPAPRLDTPTAADVDLPRLTTDPEPDPAFYELSLADALGNGRPTVVVIATPRFCQTAACGPLLDQVKQISPDHPDVDFLHIEVYQGFDDPDFDPTNPEYLSPALSPDGFNLLSEPWVFVTDEQGIITARFEGVASDEELRAALG